MVASCCLRGLPRFLFGVCCTLTVLVGSLFDGVDVPFEELPSENVDDIDAPISYLTVYLDRSIAGLLSD